LKPGTFRSIRAGVDGISNGLSVMGVPFLRQFIVQAAL
tara:strand:+ start:2261 stop:2374 length:114 start_codon:yes stop_codon:yes gene_type:complete